MTWSEQAHRVFDEAVQRCIWLAGRHETIWPFALVAEQGESGRSLYLHPVDERETQEVNFRRLVSLLQGHPENGRWTVAAIARDVALTDADTSERLEGIEVWLSQREMASARTLVPFRRIDGKIITEAPTAEAWDEQLLR